MLKITSDGIIGETPAEIPERTPGEVPTGTHE